MEKQEEIWKKEKMYLCILWVMNHT